MKTSILLLAATAFFACTGVQAQQFRVVGVIDGDTVKVLSAGRQQIKCRLHGIDAPESSMPYGERSKESLSDLVFQKQVTVEVLDQDQYGRSVCRLLLNGIDVNKLQLQRGFAWHYARYSNDAAYAQAERAARQQRIGLWADPDPTPPWSFRRNKRAGTYN